MKVPRKKENAEESGPRMSQTSGNGSDFSTATGSQSLHIERSGSRGLADSKATGPRTKQGKQASSRNAIKHGIFSKVIVLKGESRAEYEGLLARFRKALQPEGAIEGFLVEKLATTAWRQRRLLMAEGAEIRKNTEFVALDQRVREREEAENLARVSGTLNNRGLIREIHNPDIVEHCLGLLAELREQIETEGLNLENDLTILQRIYGKREENRLHDNFCDFYLILLAISQYSEEERLREGCVSPEQCRKEISLGIGKEIRRLKRCGKARTSVKAVRTQLETLCFNIPDAPTLDLQLRYEASLERTFDRTLSQLERLQRMRRGQSVLPPIKVDITR